MHTTEADLARAALHILVDQPNGEGSFGTLINLIPTVITLSPSDLVASTTRPNEAVWEQRVRNIRSHKNSEGNYIFEGYLEEISGGLRITPAGRRFIQA
jgi:hypothetical protein